MMSLFFGNRLALMCETDEASTLHFIKTNRFFSEDTKVNMVILIFLILLRQNCVQINLERLIFLKVDMSLEKFISR